jgi:hypothetical protein
MISYLGIGFSRQAVVNYNIPDLLHLVRFAFPGKRLRKLAEGASEAELLQDYPHLTTEDIRAAADSSRRSE